MHDKLALSLFALVLALISSPIVADESDLAALGWLTGCWEGEGGGGKNQECWMAPEGGMMVGVNRVISENPMFEFLRIAPHGDGLAYFASPRGAPATAFPLIEVADGHAVFAAPEHDFPQRITYRRDGDSMTARVEAQRDGKWVGFDVSWLRVPGGWAGAPSPAAADLASQVREVETAFAKTMADRDHDAFVELLSDEVIFVSKDTKRGKDQVAAQWKRFFEASEPPFSWQPETVEVLSSGTLALSTGPVFNTAGEMYSRYTSIWRREPSGGWRIVFDKGNPVCREKNEASEE